MILLTTTPVYLDLIFLFDQYQSLMSFGHVIQTLKKEISMVFGLMI
jgi:hypothetical protein